MTNNTAVQGHTPGPWTVRMTGEQYHSNEPLVEIVAADGTVIANNQKYYPEPLDPKNAYVQAAAPEMLEALYQVRRFADRNGIFIPTAVDAAIERATGKTDS